MIEFLWWCSYNADSLEPANISRDAVMAAVALVDDYVKPMTARALGDSAVPEDERGAANLAKWLLSEKPSQINLRDVSRTAGLAGLRDAEPMRKAAGRIGSGGMATAGAGCDWSGTPEGGLPGEPETDGLTMAATMLDQARAALRIRFGAAAGSGTNSAVPKSLDKNNDISMT